MSLVLSPFMVGRTVLQYQLTEKLGAGGMGEVYKARDTRLNRFVAVKVLPAGMSADPELRRRFVLEAQAASALNHPNIITIYDIVLEGDAQYMVIEYVEGKTLLELIPAQGLPVGEVIRYASQMADALGAAHAAGIIHRDLKPANIMVTGSGLVKLLDFGLAKRVDWEPTAYSGDTLTVAPAPMTVQGVILGTVDYMSPEQAEGTRLDARSDIFSFGSVLYQMLTGRSPFRGGSVISTLSAVLRDDVPPIADLAPEVPPELVRIVLRCLEKNPDLRYQSMGELQAAFAGLGRQTDTDVPDSPATIRTVAPVLKKSSGAKAVVAAALLLTAAGGGGYYWWTAGRTQPKAVPVAMGVANETKKPVAAIDVPVAVEPTRLVLADGIPVALTLSESIPRDAAEGDRVRLTAAKDIRVDGSVVIPEGAVAVGSIVDGKKKRLFGIGGKMTFQLESVGGAGGQKVSLRAGKDAHKGVSKRAVTGGGVAGTEYVVYVDGANTVLVRR
jgi:hypothetical protein